MNKDFHKIGSDIGALVAGKDAAYGPFNDCGAHLRLLFPTGIPVDKYDDMLCLVRILDKMRRVATRKDAFGESPYRDIAGYGILGVAKDDTPPPHPWDEVTAGKLPSGFGPFVPHEEKVSLCVDCQSRDNGCVMIHDPGKYIDRCRGYTAPTPSSGDITDAERERIVRCLDRNMSVEVEQRKAACGACGGHDWRGIGEAENGVTTYACVCGNTWKHSA